MGAGFKRSDIGFYVGSFPTRKKPCLWVDKDGIGYKLGQFNNEQAAHDFMDILEYVCFGKKEDEVRKMFEEWKQC